MRGRCFALGGAALLASAALAGAQTPRWSFLGYAPPSLGPRAASGVAYDTTRGCMVIFSGRTRYVGDPSDTWELTGPTWTQGPASPSGREGCAMAYDATRGKVVLFGGLEYSTGIPLADSWEYDGTAWQQMSPPASPTARSFFALTYDETRRHVALFGGWPLSNDYWKYDGSSWAQGPPPPLAAMRSSTLCHDTARGTEVLFGGAAAVSTGYSNETLETDGTNWRLGPLAPALLFPRNAVGLAYDSVRRRVVLFGGNNYDLGVVFDDTWEYDGTSWQPGPAAPPGLSARGFHMMVYDSQLDRTVVFGGTADGGVDIFFDDVWVYSTVADATDDLVACPGSGPSNPPRVRLFDEFGVPSAADFYAYGTTGWGALSAVASVDGSGEHEVLTGPGPGPTHLPHVRGFDATGSALARISFLAYGTLRFGVEPAAGEIDGDGRAEILTGPGPGVPYGPHVRAFDFDGNGVTAKRRVSFFAYATLAYGAVPSAGDVDGDAFDEIVCAPGPGPSLSQHIRGFDYDNAALAPMGRVSFVASAGKAGARVAEGDADADGHDDIVVANGPSITLASRFLAFSYGGASVQPLPGYDVSPFASMYGGRVGQGDLDADGDADLVAGAGPDPSASAPVLCFSYDAAALRQLPNAFTPYTLGFGTNAGAGALGL